MATVDMLPASACPDPNNDTARGVTATGQAEATMAWWVPVGDELAFAQTVAGNLTTINYGSGAVVRREPLRHPRYPELFATDYQIDRMASPNDNPTPYAFHKVCRVLVNFATPPYPIAGDAPYATWSRRTRRVVLTQPGRAVRYASDSKPLQLDVARGYVVHDIAVTLHQLASLNESIITTATQSPLNSTAFYTIYGTYPVGTVELQGVETPVQFTLAGVVTKQLTFHVSIRPALRWDFRPREDTGVADRLVNPDGSDWVPRSDLNALYYIGT